MCESGAKANALGELRLERIVTQPRAYIRVTNEFYRWSYALPHVLQWPHVLW